VLKNDVDTRILSGILFTQKLEVYMSKLGRGRVFLIPHSLVFIVMILLVLGLSGGSVAISAVTLDEILEGVEKRYGGRGFTARFFQTSTLKAMHVTDTASGTLSVKPPGRMRWEYEEPEKHVIITDGRKLWVYVPADNQVMIGKAPAFFGDGKGAGFLSDIRGLRRNFDISLNPDTVAPRHVLKLVPKAKTYDISVIYLSIQPETFDVVQVVTINQYEDVTRIEFSGISYNRNIEESLFSFQIPEGADIVDMSE